MTPAILIVCGPEAYCLRRSDGEDAVGAYRSEASAREAAERRGWRVAAVERNTMTLYKQRKLEREAKQ